MFAHPSLPLTPLAAKRASSSHPSSPPSRPLSSTQDAAWRRAGRLFRPARLALRLQPRRSRWAETATSPRPHPSSRGQLGATESRRLSRADYCARSPHTCRARRRTRRRCTRCSGAERGGKGARLVLHRWRSHRPAVEEYGRAADPSGDGNTPHRPTGPAARQRERRPYLGSCRPLTRTAAGVRVCSPEAPAARRHQAGQASCARTCAGARGDGSESPAPRRLPGLVTGSAGRGRDIEVEEAMMSGVVDLGRSWC
jgi:hypothetical protein